MEHRDWFDGSDERGELVYFLPANVKKAMSSAIPTEKQLNTNLLRASSTRFSQPGNSAIARLARKQTEEEMRQRARLISTGGKYAPQWLYVPPKAARWGY